MITYLDNSATTKTDIKVLEAINDFNEKYYANPSAIHRFGYLVEEEIKKATSYVASVFNVEDSEIIWTSGGTESNNLAIYAYANSYKKNGKGIITTKIEHPSVLKVCEKLSEEGFDATYLSVDSNGHISLDELRDKINDDTILVSIMHTNNEIGSVQNIADIGKLIKEKNNKTAFHVDFVQGFGKNVIDCKKQDIDFLSISAHKIHGPKGVGILYKNKNYRIMPLLLGGGQQMGLRSGTLNTTGIIGTACATKLCYGNINEERNKLLRIRDNLLDRLAELSKKYDNIYINTKKSDGFAPHIVSVSFKGIRSEVMVHALEEKEIYVSSGSACSSHSKKESATLKSIGLNNELMDSTIRVSLGRYNTTDDIDLFMSEIDRLIPILNIRKK